MTKKYIIPEAKFEMIMGQIKKSNERIKALEEYNKKLNDYECDLLIRKENIVEYKEKIKKSSNQLRGDSILKAKKFIDQFQKGYRMFEFGYIFYKIEFKINKSKRRVIALLIGEGTGYLHKRVSVICHPDDVFNEHLGKAIAIERLLEFKESEFEDVPQPDVIVKGHIAKWFYRNDDIKDSYKFDEVYDNYIYDMTHEDGEKYYNFKMTDAAEKFYDILDDTDVEYNV